MESAMGELKELDCRNCGYTAEVSGGEDCGMVAIAPKAPQL
jgi:hypothetical protein